MSKAEDESRGMSWQAWMGMMLTYSRQLKALKRHMGVEKESDVCCGGIKTVRFSGLAKGEERWLPSLGSMQESDVCCGGIKTVRFSGLAKGEERWLPSLGSMPMLLSIALRPLLIDSSCLKNPETWWNVRAHNTRFSCPALVRNVISNPRLKSLLQSPAFQDQLAVCISQSSGKAFVFPI